ncbi:MAG: VWA domain-containing protein, partial [Terracidiphilus sp.]
VVAVEEGGVSALEFDKLAKLGPLLDMFLSDGRSQAALVGFDSKPHLLLDYTRSGEDVSEALKRLQQGNGGDAILDTVSYAVDLLETQPKEYRRVLLLISEERDHGSKHTKPEQLIQKIGRSDVLVLSVSFSPSRAELLHDMKDSGDNRTMNMMSPLIMLVQAFQPLRSNARPAYDPGEDRAGLWSADCGAGGLLAGRGAVKDSFQLLAFPLLTGAPKNFWPIFT